MAQNITILKNKRSMKFSNDKSFFQPVTENKIIKYIQKIMVHQALMVLHIINIIFRTGEIIIYFKRSVVTPILKSSDKKILIITDPLALTLVRY